MVTCSIAMTLIASCAIDGLAGAQNGVPEQAKLCLSCVLPYPNGSAGDGVMGSTCTVCVTSMTWVPSTCRARCNVRGVRRTRAGLAVSQCGPPPPDAARPSTRRARCNVRGVRRTRAGWRPRAAQPHPRTPRAHRRAAPVATCAGCGERARRRFCPATAGAGHTPCTGHCSRGRARSSSRIALRFPDPTEHPLPQSFPDRSR